MRNANVSQHRCPVRVRQGVEYEVRVLVPNPFAKAPLRTASILCDKALQGLLGNHSALVHKVQYTTCYLAVLLCSLTNRVHTLCVT